jgi:hypothetical protein
MGIEQRFAESSSDETFVENLVNHAYSIGLVARLPGKFLISSKLEESNGSQSLWLEVVEICLEIWTNIC